MKNLPILHYENLPKLLGSRLLIDTNFIIESNRHADLFKELVFALKSRSREIFTLEVIKKEFLYGAQTRSELNSLEGFFTKLISNIETSIQCFSAHLQTTTKLYRNYKKISLEDFMIVCYLLEHKDCILLTKNHSDFPLRIFNRIGFILSEYENEIQHYAFYSLNERKVEGLLNDFEKTP